jgi:MFS transporter, ACS family, tartrate transporter
VFEVPATLLVARKSARIWLARMMIVWGVAAAGMGLLSGVREFFVLRILLGIAEAGFFPRIIVYLSNWFLRADRARAIGALAVGLPLANMLGAPLSGWLLRQRWYGVTGWRWLFVVEGLPAVIAGLATLRYLTERPRVAHWLSPTDREFLESTLEAERALSSPGAHTRWRAALGDRRLQTLALIWFLDNMGVYGFNFWLPMILKRLSGLSSSATVTLASAPFVGAVFSSLFASISSDRSGERRWHTTLPMMIFALGLAGSVATGKWPLAAFGMLCVAALGLTSGTPAFWALTTASRGQSSSMHVAIITSCGALGGFCGPYLIGALHTATDGFGSGLMVLAGAVSVGAVLVLSHAIVADSTPATGITES